MTDTDAISTVVETPILQPGEIDGSLCGEPLDLYINDGQLSPLVEKAAVNAIADPDVRMIAGRYNGIDVASGVAKPDQFREQQGKLLRSWRAKNHPGLPGSLLVRTLTASDATGTDRRWVFVVYAPGKAKRKPAVDAG